MKRLTTAFLAALLMAWALPAHAADNLIRNGDFEDFEEGWEIPHPDTGTVTYEKTGGPVGPAFARLSPTNSASPKLFYLQQHTNDPKPGTYVAKVHFRLGEEYAAKMPTFYVNVLKPGGGYHGIYQLTPRKSATPGEWIVLEKDVEVPDGTQRIYFQVTVLGAMGHVDVDGVELSLKPAGAAPTTEPNAE